MSSTAPSAARLQPPTLAERIQWAEQWWADTQREAKKHPEDRALQLAAQARWRELAALIELQHAPKSHPTRGA